MNKRSEWRFPLRLFSPNGESEGLLRRKKEVLFYAVCSSDEDSVLSPVDVSF